MNNYNTLNKIAYQTRDYDEELNLIKDFLSYLHNRKDDSSGKQEHKIGYPLTGSPGTGLKLMPHSGTSAMVRQIQKAEHDLTSQLSKPHGKTRFLVFKNQKYTTIETKNIAFFYVRNDSTYIMCFNNTEYPLNKSLDNIYNLVPSDQFFRVNRKYLVNFNAIKEVEHYFLRKLFVKLTIDTPDQLLITKEKTHNFLSWMENR